MARFFTKKKEMRAVGIINTAPVNLPLYSPGSRNANRRTTNETEAIQYNIFLSFGIAVLLSAFFGSTEKAY